MNGSPLIGWITWYVGCNNINSLLLYGELLNNKCTPKHLFKFIFFLYRLTDIILFRLSFKIFKMCLLKRSFHSLIKKNVLFSSSTDVVSHNPPPFEAQRPRCHMFPSPIDVRSSNPLPFRDPRPYKHTVLCPPPSGLSLLADT